MPERLIVAYLVSGLVLVAWMLSDEGERARNLLVVFIWPWAVAIQILRACDRARRNRARRKKEPNDA